MRAVLLPGVGIRRAPNVGIIVRVEVKELWLRPMVNFTVLACEP